MTSNRGRLLVIAPHPDDEVLGAGGTIARFARNGGHVTVLTVAAHMPPLYPPEVHERSEREARRAHEVLGVRESVFLNYPAVLLDETPLWKFNNHIHEIVESVEPHVLLVPFFDRHVDHRQVFEASMVASRPINKARGIKLIASYEALSETHWNASHLEPNFTPNWTVDITDVIDVKLQAMACYESQVHAYPQPRSMEAIKALALFRGSQAGFGYGESFHIVRLTAPAEGILK